MKKNLQINIWTAAAGFFVLVQLGFWASYFFVGPAVPLLLFASVTFVMSVFFTLTIFLIMRFVPEDKRLRWGIPIMSLIVAWDFANLALEMSQETVQAKTLLTIPLNVAVLVSLWYLKRQHETRSRQSDK